MPKAEVLMKKELLSSSLSIWDFDGDIDDIIRMLNEIKKANPDYESLSIQISWYDDTIDVEVWGHRKETLEEIQKRLATIKERAKIKAEIKHEKEKEERKELERLMKKYGKNNG